MHSSTKFRKKERHDCFIMVADCRLNHLSSSTCFIDCPLRSPTLAELGRRHFFHSRVPWSVFWVIFLEYLWRIFALLFTELLFEAMVEVRGKTAMPKKSDEGLDPFSITREVVSDEDLLAVWGPKCSIHGFNYRLKQDWVKEVEKIYAQVYGSEKVANYTISERFARCFLAHKVGLSVNWAKFSAMIEGYRFSRYGSRYSSKPKQKNLSKSFIHSKTGNCRKNERKEKFGSVKKPRTQKQSKEGWVLDAEPSIQQINSLIQELNSRIEVQQQLKAGYEERLKNMEEFLNSYSSLSKNVSEEVNGCRDRINELKDEIKKHKNRLAEKVGEICVLWQSGYDKETLIALIIKEKNCTEIVKKVELELDGYMKKLEENTLLEEACKRKKNEKGEELEKMEDQVVGIDAAITELQDTLKIQLKYKQHLEQLQLPSEVNYSISPLPVYHPLLEKTDALTVINVSPCPVCNLYFESEVVDIVVASCKHTFHPFCLVSQGNLLRKCPKCMCPLHDMWLKSFGALPNTSKLSAKGSPRRMHPGKVC